MMIPAGYKKAGQGTMLVEQRDEKVVRKSKFFQRIWIKVLAHGARPRSRFVTRSNPVMKRTTLRPSLAMTYPLSMGHSVREKEGPAIIRPAFNNVLMWPAGSIYSSVKELSFFVIALMNEGRLEGKQVLSPMVCAKLSGEYVSMPGDPDVHYGYGLLSFEQRGVKIVMHER
jgi:hypothetical protein